MVEWTRTPIPPCWATCALPVGLRQVHPGTGHRCVWSGGSAISQVRLDLVEGQVSTTDW